MDLLLISEKTDFGEPSPLFPKRKNSRGGPVAKQKSSRQLILGWNDDLEAVNHQNTKKKRRPQPITTNKTETVKQVVSCPPYLKETLETIKNESIKKPAIISINFDTIQERGDKRGLMFKKAIRKLESPLVSIKKHEDSLDTESPMKSGISNYCPDKASPLKPRQFDMLEENSKIRGQNISPPKILDYQKKQDLPKSYQRNIKNSREKSRDKNSQEHSSKTSPARQSLSFPKRDPTEWKQIPSVHYSGDAGRVSPISPREQSRKVNNKMPVTNNPPNRFFHQKFKIQPIKEEKGNENDGAVSTVNDRENLITEESGKFKEVMNQVKIKHQKRETKQVQKNLMIRKRQRIMPQMQQYPHLNASSFVLLAKGFEAPCKDYSNKAVSPIQSPTNTQVSRIEGGELIIVSTNSSPEAKDYNSRNQTDVLRSGNSTNRGSQEGFTSRVQHVLQHGIKGKQKELSARDVKKLMLQQKRSLPKFESKTGAAGSPCSSREEDDKVRESTQSSIEKLEIMMDLENKSPTAFGLNDQVSSKYRESNIQINNKDNNPRIKIYGNKPQTVASNSQRPKKNLQLKSIEDDQLAMYRQNTDETEYLHSPHFTQRAPEGTYIVQDKHRFMDFSLNLQDMKEPQPDNESSGSKTMTSGLKTGKYSSGVNSGFFTKRLKPIPITMGSKSSYKQLRQRYKFNEDLATERVHHATQRGEKPIQFVQDFKQTSKLSSRSKHRPCMDPNTEKVRQLNKYHKEHIKNIELVPQYPSLKDMYHLQENFLTHRNIIQAEIKEEYKGIVISHKKTSLNPMKNDSFRYTMSITGSDIESPTHAQLKVESPSCEMPKSRNLNAAKINRRDSQTFKLTLKSGNIDPTSPQLLMAPIDPNDHVFRSQIELLSQKDGIISPQEAAETFTRQLLNQQVIQTLEAQYKHTKRLLTPEKPSDYESRGIDSKRIKREKQSFVLDQQTEVQTQLLRRKSAILEEKQDKINILMKIKDINSMKQYQVKDLQFEKDKVEKWKQYKENQDLLFQSNKNKILQSLQQKHRKMMLKSRDATKKRSLSYDLNDQEFLNKLHNKIIQTQLDDDNLKSETEIRVNSGIGSTRNIIYSNEFDGKILVKNNRSIFNETPRESYQNCLSLQQLNLRKSQKNPGYVIGKKHLEKKLEKLIKKNSVIEPKLQIISKSIKPPAPNCIVVMPRHVIQSQHHSDANSTFQESCYSPGTISQISPIVKQSKFQKK